MGKAGLSQNAPVFQNPPNSLRLVAFHFQFVNCRNWSISKYQYLYLFSIHNPTYMYIYIYIKLFTTSSYLFYQLTILISPPNNIHLGFPNEAIECSPSTGFGQRTACKPRWKKTRQALKLLVVFRGKTGIAGFGHICFISWDIYVCIWK